VCLSVASALACALAACPRTGGGGGGGRSRRHAPITLTSGAGSEELRQDQASEEAASYSDLLWGADSDSPSIWAFTGSRDYFIPRVGLRFVLPVGYHVDTSSLPTQHLVLEGLHVPPVARGERLYGDRTLHVRGESPAIVTIVLLEIPMTVEPSTFCAWAAGEMESSPTIARDEAQSLASSTTRVCELSAGSDRTRVRGFLRAGWLLALSQPMDGGDSTVQLDAIVASIRAFD
jgi:hypothetical protein